MSDEPRIPPYLLRRDDREVDRSALCKCVDLKSFQADVTCERCGGSGLRPSDDDDELTPDQIRALGYTPIEEGDPRGERETFIEGYDS